MLTDEEKKSILQRDIDELGVRLKEARGRLRTHETNWEQELNNSQPDELKIFRKQLAGNLAVTEVFDPWYMDEDTKDAIPFRLNKQFSKNEQLHSHHLHLTVREPKLL